MNPFCVFLRIPYLEVTMWIIEHITLLLENDTNSYKPLLNHRQFMMKKSIYNKYLAFTLLFFSISVTSQAIANDDVGLPLWEISLGAGAIHQPFYTGSKQTRQVAFPIVFPTYRGEIFKSDEEGVRAQLLRNDRFSLDLSADFNLAIKSDEIDLRKGLDDIENVLQLGPSLELLLDQKENSTLLLSIPVRGAFEVGSDGVDSVGFNISPNLSYQRTFSALDAKWKFGATVGPQFGTSKYHNIYYGVDSEFATSERNSYETESGYSGSRLQLDLTSKGGGHNFLWFVRYDNIDGATFDDSPLVETNHSLAAGMLYTYDVLQSKQRVSP